MHGRNRPATHTSTRRRGKRVWTKVLEHILPGTCRHAPPWPMVPKPRAPHPQMRNFLVTNRNGEVDSVSSMKPGSIHPTMSAAF